MFWQIEHGVWERVTMNVSVRYASSARVFLSSSFNRCEWTKWQTLDERWSSQWWREMSWDVYSEDSSKRMKELCEERPRCLISWKHASVFTLFFVFGLIREAIWNHTNLRPDLSKQNLHHLSHAVFHCMNESWFCFALKRSMSGSETGGWQHKENVSLWPVQKRKASSWMAINLWP